MQDEQKPKPKFDVVRLIIYLVIVSGIGGFLVLKALISFYCFHSDIGYLIYSLAGIILVVGLLVWIMYRIDSIYRR